MKLRCSRGCTFKVVNGQVFGYGHMEAGDRCRMPLGYDIMTKQTYCRRILRKID